MRKRTICIKFFAISLVCVLFASACAHSVRITTDPEGADVSVNGIFLGKSPVILHERTGIPQNYFIKIEKKGYKAVDTVMAQTYKADITLLWLIPGLFPYFFTADLEDNYRFSLRPNR